MARSPSNQEHNIVAHARFLIDDKMNGVLEVQVVEISPSGLYVKIDLNKSWLSTEKLRSRIVEKLGPK